jgi:hypothetical protein
VDALVTRPIPLAVPTVQVDMLWHRQSQALDTQRWLREAVWRTVPGAAAVGQETA